MLCISYRLCWHGTVGPASLGRLHKNLEGVIVQSVHADVVGMFIWV